jgi:DnaJ domain
MRNLTAYYSALELERGASLTEIQQAYQDLAMVWHPDRFNRNPRLQHKAQLTFQEVHEAYEQLTSYHLNQQQTPISPPKPYSSSTSRAASPSVQAVHAQTRTSDPSGLKSRPYTFVISLQDAREILVNYPFRAVKAGSGYRDCYECEPFHIEVQETVPEVLLSVPCESVNTFHRVLLTIPCKSTGCFYQLDAQELISLLKQNLDRSYL